MALDIVTMLLSRSTNMQQYLRELVHNVVVHPLMTILPDSLAVRLHDANANWVFGPARYSEMQIELAGPRHPWREAVHNLLIHPAMMFMPANAANRLHDANATWAFNLPERTP